MSSFPVRNTTFTTQPQGATSFGSQSSFQTGYQFRPPSFQTSQPPSSFSQQPSTNNPFTQGVSYQSRLQQPSSFSQSRFPQTQMGGINSSFNQGTRQKGTKYITLKPVAHRDQQTCQSCYINNITALPEFTDYSIQELRFVDFKQYPGEYKTPNQSQYSSRLPQTSYQTPTNPYQQTSNFPTSNTFQRNQPFGVPPNTQMQSPFTQNSTNPFASSFPNQMPNYSMQTQQMPNYSMSGFPSQPSPFGTQSFQSASAGRLPTARTFQPPNNPFASGSQIGQTNPYGHFQPFIYPQQPMQTQNPFFSQTPRSIGAPNSLMPPFRPNNSLALGFVPGSLQPSTTSVMQNPFSASMPSMNPFQQSTYTPTQGLLRPQTGHSASHIDSLNCAYKDPHGLSMLFPNQVPENILKKYEKPLNSFSKAVQKPKQADNHDWYETKMRFFKRKEKPADKYKAKEDSLVFSQRNIKEQMKIQPFSFKQDSFPFTKATSTSSEITVTLHQPKFTQLKIPILSSSQGRHIKQRLIESFPELHPNQFMLVYHSKMINDSDFLSSLRIRANQEIQVVFIPKSVQTSPEPANFPIFTKEGYSTSPSMVQIMNMTAAQLRSVSNFTISNQYGKIQFQGVTDLTGLNLDEIVFIEKKAVTLYSDNIQIKKPPIGHGLNKRAVISLYGCFSRTGTSNQEFRKKIEALCLKDGSEFLSWDSNTGEWRFRVSHF